MGTFYLKKYSSTTRGLSRTSWALALSERFLAPAEPKFGTVNISVGGLCASKGIRIWSVVGVATTP